MENDVTPVNDEVLSVEEVALRLKVSDVTVRRMLNDGRLPGIRVGRQWRVASTTVSRALRGEIRLDVPRVPKVAR